MRDVMSGEQLDEADRSAAAAHRTAARQGRAERAPRCLTPTLTDGCVSEV